MAYTKRYPGGFVDKPTLTTATDAQFYNAVETALLKIFDTDPSADGQVLQWINASTKYGPALLLNKNIDPAAAIAKSKLDLTGANGIVNADVAGAAAISRSKLDFGSGLVQSDMAAGNKITASSLAGGPPGGPITGDIWIATGAPNGAVWAFRYDSTAATYKWLFIGGGKSITPDATTAIPGTATWTSLTSITAARAGVYTFEGGWNAIGNAGGAGTYQVGVGIAGVISLGRGGIVAAASNNFTINAIPVSVTVTAGQAINLMGWANAAPTGPAESMSITPVAVI